MIASLWANLIWIVGGLINNTASWSINPDWLSALSEILGYAKAFDSIIPVVTMIQVLLTLIGFEIFLIVIRLIISIINWARGAGGISIDI